VKEKVKQDRLDTSELLGFENNTLINFHSSQPDLDITIRKDGKDNYLEVNTINYDPFHEFHMDLL
jgi:hypothetical protein